jgi:hypothetical protein
MLLLQWRLPNHTFIELEPMKSVTSVYSFYKESIL